MAITVISKWRCIFGQWSDLFYLLHCSAPCVLFKFASFHQCIAYSRVTPPQLLCQRFASTHSHVVQE